MQALHRNPRRIDPRPASRALNKPVPNNLAYNAAVNRLNHWQITLLDAETAGDENRMREAARFIEEYRQLIADMTAATATRAAG